MLVTAAPSKQKHNLRGKQRSVNSYVDYMISVVANTFKFKLSDLMILCF